MGDLFKNPGTWLVLAVLLVALMIALFIRRRRESPTTASRGGTTLGSGTAGISVDRGAEPGSSSTEAAVAGAGLGAGTAGVAGAASPAGSDEPEDEPDNEPDNEPDDATATETVSTAAQEQAGPEAPAAGAAEPGIGTSPETILDDTSGAPDLEVMPEGGPEAAAAGPEYGTTDSGTDFAGAQDEPVPHTTAPVDEPVRGQAWQDETAAESAADQGQSAGTAIAGGAVAGGAGAGGAVAGGAYAAATSDEVAGSDSAPAELGSEADDVPRDTEAVTAEPSTVDGTVESPEAEILDAVVGSPSAEDTAPTRTGPETADVPTADVPTAADEQVAEPVEQPPDSTGEGQAYSEATEDDGSGSGAIVSGGVPAAGTPAAGTEAPTEESTDEWSDESSEAPTAESAGPYGADSAEPLDDGSAPEGFTVKGNADSMLFHTEESPYYARTRGEVWFSSEEAARAAGFTRWDEI